MPDKGFIHRHPEFEALIRIVADQLGIDPYLAEKDYWIMHCLFGLQQAGYDFQLKGGTSLSKGHGLIHRFSEDIDIHISPPAGLELKTGKNHDKPQHVQGRKCRPELSRRLAFLRIWIAPVCSLLDSNSVGDR